MNEQKKNKKSGKNKKPDGTVPTALSKLTTFETFSLCISTRLVKKPDFNVPVEFAKTSIENIESSTNVISQQFLNLLETSV